MPEVSTFIAIYRGETISGSKIVAVTADEEIVAAVVKAVLREEQSIRTVEDDPVVRTLGNARRRALKFISRQPPERKSCT